MIQFSNEVSEKSTIVIPCFEKENKFTNYEKEIKEWIEQAEWKAKKGKKLEITVNKNKIVLLGLGKKENFKIVHFRTQIAEYAKNDSNFVLDGVNLPQTECNLRNIVEALYLSQYKFDKYKTSKKEENKKHEIDLLNFAKNQNIIEEAKILADATIIARNLVNEPANVIYPETLATKAEEAGKDSGFEVEIFEEVQIDAWGMEAFLSVARAAEKRPRLIVMRYFGDKENKNDVLGFVGKGLTYDTGGLSLKPTAGMVNMKCDMGGSAAVIGAMTAIAKMKLKRNVVTVVAACENSIGGNAYRPGDIINSMGGKTIEIGNTDAEGRLTLIDAVTYIIEKENATKVVDIATLTGAVLMALGKERSGVLSNNDAFYQSLEKASELSGEKVWRLPHDKEYAELLKSPVADLNNIGGKLAGTVTAGLFIHEFIQDKPWIHIDIAGTAWTDKPKGEFVKGATGAGARLLYFLAKQK